MLQVNIAPITFIFDMLITVTQLFQICNYKLYEEIN